MGLGLGLLGAGIAIGLGAFGAALGQGKAIASSAESIGRNPETGSFIRTTLLIGLAFIESLCLYALVISIMIMGKAA
ncbi:MAG: ATP synthase F0 subunit C [Chloroflexi bacterium]|nr:ATP synthase F0 subunit C [Chloroflexota bacterium]